MVRHAYDVDFSLGEETYKPKAVWEAAEEGNVDEIKLSLQHGKDINSPNPITSDTPLIIAAKARNMEVLSILLSFGADVNIPNALGDTPLHWAAYHGNKDMVTALLSKGAKIESKGEYGNTPIHLACTEGHLEVVSILLQEGASVSSKNVFGNNALMLSLNPEIAKMVKAIAEREMSREALKQSEKEKAEKKKLEEEEKQRHMQALEAEKREKEEKDRAKREAILAEEKRIEEEELAKEQAEAEELRRQVSGFTAGLIFNLQSMTNTLPNSHSHAHTDLEAIRFQPDKHSSTVFHLFSRIETASFRREREERERLKLVLSVRAAIDRVKGDGMINGKS